NANPEGEALLEYSIPIVGTGELPDDPSLRTPNYRPLPPTAIGDILTGPGVVQLTLPAADELRLWTNLDPLEAGVKDFPPSLEDSHLNQRLITWLKITASAAVRTKLLWLGINTVPVTQKARVTNELLPDGTGVPDQVVVLSRKSIVPKSVRLVVSTTTEVSQWQEIMICSRPVR